jgi:hypothetical protein
VRCQRIDYTALQAAVRSIAAVSDAMAQGMTDMTRAKSEGLDKAGPRIAENTTPTRSREWREEVFKPAIEA